MFCDECGTQNRETSRFCVKCGTALGAAQQQSASPQRSPGGTASPAPPIAAAAAYAVARPQATARTVGYPSVLKWWFGGISACLSLSFLLLGTVGIWQFGQHLGLIFNELSKLADPGPTLLLVSNATDNSFVMSWEFTLAYLLMLLIIATAIGVDAISLSRRSRTGESVAGTAGLWVALGILLPMIAVPGYFAVREKYCEKHGLI